MNRFILQFTPLFHQLNIGDQHNSIARPSRTAILVALGLKSLTLCEKKNPPTQDPYHKAVVSGKTNGSRWLSLSREISDSLRLIHAEGALPMYAYIRVWVGKREGGTGAEKSNFRQIKFWRAGREWERVKERAQGA